MTDTPVALSLDDLDARHPAITQAIGGALAEAAKVCLAQHHSSPITLNIREGPLEDIVLLEWKPASNRAHFAWGDQNDRIEWGSVCVALAFLGEARDLVAVRRARRGSGADYYVAAKGASIEDLEGVVRLEISGIDRSGVPDVRRRLTVKLDQLRQGSAFEPGIAIVVGFAAREVHLATLDAS